MKTDRTIHNPTHRLKNILGDLFSHFKNLDFPENELIVLNYHGTQKKFVHSFLDQLEFYEKHFQFISPAELENYYSNKIIVSKKPLLLLTFDDGIKNNLYAAECLHKKNIKAYFFVIPGFTNTDKNLQKYFFIQNVRPLINNQIDSTEDDFVSMTWQDIKSLIANGHSIGSHTLTHTLVSDKFSANLSLLEISGSKTLIEKSTGAKINSYCSPNDSLLSTGEKEMAFIKENYLYHFSTYPGSNLIEKNPFFIHRINIESYWLPGAVKYAIGKFDRKRWRQKNELFRDIAG